MDYRKDLLLASAARLYSLGVDLEAARERLSRLVEDGVSFSSPEMEQAYRDFQELDQHWKKLEKEHLDLRREILRDAGRRMVEEAQKGFESADRGGWLTSEEVEAALLSDFPDQDNPPRVRAAESLFGCIPGSETIEQTKKERREK